MTRVNGWEKLLKNVIEKHMGLPSQYGISDCYIIADDAVEAVTGERINENLVGGYTNEIGAAKKLLQNGFKTVEDVFASKFETIPASLAQRGDVGVTVSNGEICGGVFTALGFMVRDDAAIRFIPISNVKTAFKVGR